MAAYAAANAENPRKGYKLGELTTDEVLAYAACEMFELARAPDDVSELADLLGCLFHYAQRKGWSMALIERELMRKLVLRFPGTAIGLAFAGVEAVMPTPPERAGDTQGYTHGYAPEEVIYGSNDGRGT